MQKTYFDKNNKLNIPENGQIPLHYDKEAVKAYFVEEVNSNLRHFEDTEEKIRFLLEHDYIEAEIIDKYSSTFINKLFQYLEDKHFRFDSFMGAYKFYKQYAMKENDDRLWVEKYEDRIAFNALTLANGNEELAMSIAEEMIERRYQPATPTFLNAGKKRRGEFVSCFLIDLRDDMNSIGRGINSALQLSRIGGGVGVNLSNLRSSGAPIKLIENRASGIVPVMKLLEDAFKYSNQLGQRAGSGVTYLSVFHPDIEDFLSTRIENAEESKRIKSLSLAVVMPDKFYELARNKEYMFLFEPYDVERVYGKPFSYVNITEEYDNMVANPQITKTKIKASKLEEDISKLQQESGYPYIMNVDTVNEKNPNDGTIIMSNLCSEILQSQNPHLISDDQTYETLGSDISCNLGSTNIPNMMRSGSKFGHSIRTAVRALTYVTEESNIEAVPTVKRGNELNHAIGLGAMGLHTSLAENQIEYGSPESIEFTSIYFKLLNYWTLYESNQIAKEKETTFYGFEKSSYADGSYFDKYTYRHHDIEHPRVADLFKDIYIPNENDWLILAADVQQFGLYHAYRLAVAPTGSISYVNETSASIHPITQLVEKRQEGKTGATYYPAPKLSNESLPYYKSAYDMSMLKVIDVYAAAQEHVDQGMSLTLFVRSDIPEGIYPWKEDGETEQTTRDLTLLRHYAWLKGIKTLYYVRTYTDDEEEIGANQCESCSI